MIDIKLMPYIEKALGIKLYDEQIEGLVTNYYMWIHGRFVGRTTAYMIKLALSNGEPIRRSKICFYTDEDSNDSQYSSWFFNKFMDIREKLKFAGFEVREIELDKQKDKIKMILCKIDVEEEAKCKKCCMCCTNKCGQKCVFLKTNLDCGNQIILYKEENND